MRRKPTAPCICCGSDEERIVTAAPRFTNLKLILCLPSTQYIQNLVEVNRYGGLQKGSCSISNKYIDLGLGGGLGHNRESPYVPAGEFFFSFSSSLNILAAL